MADSQALILGLYIITLKVNNNNNIIIIIIIIISIFLLVFILVNGVGFDILK